MFKVFIQFTTALALFLPTSAQHAWAKESVKANKKAVYKARFNPQPDHMKKLMLTQKPFRLLPLKQLVHLNKKNRILYVRQLRQMAIEAEKAQFMFRGSKYSSFGQNTYDNFAELNRLLFFGDYVDAQMAGNNCVYGYGMSTYPPGRAGRRQPFECLVPESQKCTSGGVKCGYTLSGIPDSTPGNCISKSAAYRSTQECEKLRSALAKDNQIKVREAIDGVRKYFSMNESNAKVSKDQLRSTGAMEWIKRLADVAYSDEAYAELLYLMSLYRSAGVDLPASAQEVLGPIYSQVLQPKNFERTFDSVQASLNSIYAQYENHCNAEVPPDEIKLITDPAWQAEVARKSGAANEQEKRRLQSIKAVQSSGGTFTIRNSIEEPECNLISQRKDRIAQKLREIEGSFPLIVDNGIIKTPPPPLEEYHARATGCSKTVVSEEHELYQPTALCTKCLFDKQMEKTAANYGGAERDKREGYDTSDKWVSLMTTMVVACNQGVDSTGRIIDMPTMVEKMKTFGYCSNETYSWNENNLSQQDKQKVKNWQNRNLWYNDDGLPDNTNDDFKRIYGINYDAATKLFCDDDQFSTGIFTGKVRKIKKDYEHPVTNEAERIADYRKRFQDFVSGKKNIQTFKSLKNHTSPELYACMTESVKTAQELFSGNPRTCVKTVKVGDSRDAQLNFAKMIQEVRDYNGTAVVAGPAECHVAYQYESDTRGIAGDKSKMKEAISFVAPASDAINSVSTGSSKECDKCLSVDFPEDPYRCEIFCGPGSSRKYAKIGYLQDNPHAQPSLAAFPQFYRTDGSPIEGRGRRFSRPDSNLYGFSYTMIDDSPNNSCAQAGQKLGQSSSSGSAR